METFCFEMPLISLPGWPVTKMAGNHWTTLTKQKVVVVSDFEHICIML